MLPTLEITLKHTHTHTMGDPLVTFTKQNTVDYFNILTIRL